MLAPSGCFLQEIPVLKSLLILSIAKFFRALILKGIPEKWDPGPGTRDTGPSTWVPGSGTNRLDPGNGTFTWDPGPYMWEPVHAILLRGMQGHPFTLMPFSLNLQVSSVRNLVVSNS